jgi:hypothetical protein
MARVSRTSRDLTLETSKTSIYQVSLMSVDRLTGEQDMQSACTVLEEPLVSFDTLKEVRDIEKQILPLEPIMKSLGEVVHGLQEENKRLPNPNDDNQVLCLSIQATLEQFQREAVSYKNQALYIHRRAQLTAQSISDSLSLGFQQLAQSQSTNTMSMAKSAREDSVAIRAITLVTSFYMPFSFVAVSQVL